MSDFQIVCDAIRDDLVGNIPALFDAKLHMYEPWDPELLDAAEGEWHLAIWPAGEELAETASQLGTGAQLLSQVYEIWVWQGAVVENERLKRDEPAALKLFEVHNAIRDRLYREANESFGGSKLSWYRGTQLPSSISRVRWFRIPVRVERLQAFAQLP